MKKKFAVCFSGYPRFVRTTFCNIKNNFKVFESNIKSNSIKLSEDQKKSLKEMVFLNNKFRVHVLQGTTGSGKTFVYFEALKSVLKKGFQGLISVSYTHLTLPTKRIV